MGERLVHSHSRGIFLRKDELLCLAAPLLFVPFILWELSLPGKLPESTYFIAALICEVVLGGTTHTGLTWGFFALSPEFRFLLRDKKFSPFRIAATGFLFFIIAAALFCLPSKETAVYYVKLFFIIDWFMVYHHSLTQTQGLSFVYSYKMNQHAEALPLIRKIHKLQKVAFALLFLSVTLPGLHYILGWPIADTPLQKGIGAAIAFALVCFIIYLNRRLPLDHRNKDIFLARLFLFPISYYSIIAAVSYRALHGIEYIFIYRKILRSSRTRLLKISRKTVAISVSLILFVALLSLFSINPRDGFARLLNFQEELPIWFRLLCALSVARSYMHYYMDRVIFRMRDPASTHWLSPLLNS